MTKATVKRLPGKLNVRADAPPSKARYRSMRVRLQKVNAPNDAKGERIPFRGMIRSQPAFAAQVPSATRTCPLISWLKESTLANVPYCAKVPSMQSNSGHNRFLKTVPMSRRNDAYTAIYFYRYL